MIALLVNLLYYHAKEGDFGTKTTNLSQILAHKNNAPHDRRNRLAMRCSTEISDYSDVSGSGSSS